MDRVGERLKPLLVGPREKFLDFFGPQKKNGVAKESWRPHRCEGIGIHATLSRYLQFVKSGAASRISLAVLRT